jgi:uncharacterized surface protein with fasciclin (FAS1) repeats
VTSTLQRSGLVVAATLALTLAACSSGDSGSSASSSSSSASSSAPASESSASPADGPFGPGCAGLPAEGEGSAAGMVDDPVVTAAANNPLLTSLAQAMTAANLAESLNGQQNITVLAPVNDAFAAIPPDQVQALMADTPRLTSVLLHHVIQGRLAPDRLAGKHTTLNNDEVTVEGSGQSFTVAGAGTITQTGATVICGNVQTATATVYLIDQVLAPTAQ